MSALKKLFQKANLERKFKKAGQGHKLTEPGSSKSNNGAEKPQQKEVKSSQELTDERKKAAEAALARVSQEKEKNKPSKQFRHTNAIKAQVKDEQKDMEEAMAIANKYYASGTEVEASAVLGGIFFKCPITGSEDALPRREMEKRIEEFLYSQLPEEPQLTSILMIHTFNENKAEIKACIDILTKYLTNVVENPKNESYRRIKSSNRVLNEKVLSCRGGIEFLQSVGFEKKTMAVDGGSEEEYYVLDTEGVDEDELMEKLKGLLTSLQEGEPIEMELDRDIKVFAPSQGESSKFNVPDEFYAMTSEEVKREQKRLEETMKDMERLMTKEMREREKSHNLKKYKYAAIRVKFPDGFVIQGTFGASESFDSVREFVLECIELDYIPFDLTVGFGQKISENGKTITELNLAPASLLQFSFDQNVLKDIIRQNNAVETNRFLKNELVELALKI